MASHPLRTSAQNVPLATIAREDSHIAMTRLAQLDALLTLIAIADASDDLTPSEATRDHAHGLVCELTDQIHDALARGVDHE